MRLAIVAPQRLQVPQVATSSAPSTRSACRYSAISSPIRIGVADVRADTRHANGCRVNFGNAACVFELSHHVERHYVVGLFVRYPDKEPAVDRLPFFRA